MHKSKTYGMILLKQKYKQNDKQILDFAAFFARTLPYTQDEICRALSELITEDVLQIEGEYIMQKRMIKDNEISEKRAKSGSKGGNSTANNTPKKEPKIATAKKPANAEYENDIESVVNYLNNKASTDFKTKTKATRDLVVARLKDGYNVDQFKTVIDKKTKEWLATDMAMYLRPETLFGNKFEGYLNQNIPNSDLTTISNATTNTGNKNANSGRNAAQDKRNELIDLKGQSTEFLRRTSG